MSFRVLLIMKVTPKTTFLLQWPKLELPWTLIEKSCETFGTKIDPFLAAVDWQLIVGVKMEICERHLST